MLASIARFALQHRRIVIVTWLVLLLAGALGAGRVSKRLSFDFALPGQAGYETARQIDRIYGNGGERPPSIFLVTVPRGQTGRADASTLATAFAHVRRAAPQLRIVDYASTQDAGFITADGRTTFVVPAFSLTTGETEAGALANHGPARAAYDRPLAGGIPGGVLTTLEVLTSSTDAAAAPRGSSPSPGSATPPSPGAPDSNRDATTVVIGIPQTQTANSNTLAPVRAAEVALADQPGVVGIAGEGAISLAYENAVFGNFPLMFAIIAGVTFVLLARAFRSIVLALKALILNLLSLAATFGVMTWFWQQGHGSNPIFGIPTTGAITFWLPLMIFAFLYGLSMDYEAFILTRVRKEYERTGSTSAALVEGLGRTGRLVTSAALIPFLAFASLTSAPNTDIKVFATGLRAGILLDATLIRALLLPALVALLGRWNWWMPTLCARLLRIEPAPRPAAELSASAQR